MHSLHLYASVQNFKSIGQVEVCHISIIRFAADGHTKNKQTTRSEVKEKSCRKEVDIPLAWMRHVG
jgi:hypothetical protein